MASPLGTLGGLVAVFMQVHMSIRLNNLNKKTLEVLKVRVDSMHRIIQSLLEDSEIIKRAFQSVQELVRRFHATVQSAILLVERLDLAWTANKIWRSQDFKYQLDFINAELTGCSSDASMIFSLKLYGNQVNQHAEILAQLEAVKAGAEAYSKAVEEDAQTTKMALLDLEQVVKNNQEQNLTAIRQAKIEILEQVASINSGGKDPAVAVADPANAKIKEDLDLLREEAKAHAQGIHDHLDRVGNGIANKVDDLEANIMAELERNKKELMNALNKTALAMNAPVNPAHISHLTKLLVKPRHIIHVAKHSTSPDDPESLVPVVFKAINPGPSQIITPQDIARSETELLVLMRLRNSPYTPKPIGYYQPDARSAGVVMEGIFWRPSLSKAKGIMFEELWRKSSTASMVQSFASEPSPSADARLYQNDDFLSMTLRDYVTTHIVEWSMRLRFMRQFTSALSFIHGNHIVHGGLSSWDVLVAQDVLGYEHVRVIDFDRSYITGETDLSRHFVDVGSRLACHAYTAPEMFKGPGRGKPTYATDIFAAGTILWELAFCTVPYGNLEPEDVALSISDGYREPIPTRNDRVPDGIPPDLALAIYKAWLPSPTERLVAREMDDIVSDVYVPNVSTTRRISPNTSRHTIEQFRDAFLRARQGVSIDDLVSVRTVAETLLHDRFPHQDRGWTLAKRTAEAVHLLRVAVDTLSDGGAAYYLATKIYSPSTPDGAKWLQRAVELGHPLSIQVAAEIALREGKMGASEFAAVKKNVEELTSHKRRLVEERRKQRGKNPTLTMVLASEGNGDGRAVEVMGTL
ncbi:hypothetical protein DFJ73DRAFT_849583 [Zopfochytrium polystomum]|nr:hypothetical protein DFJ73DRAFT_849583 [Zopfochytrium polystomum]